MPTIRAEQANGAPASESKRRKPRVILYKNEDGSFDTSSMSDEDKARIFGGSSGAATAPPPAADPAAAVDPIDPAVIALALGLLTSIESAVVGQKLGIPQERVFQTLQLKPPFDGLVTNAACKVANKYGASLGPYSDEIALVALLATWQIGAFAELRAIAAELRATAPTPPPPNVDHDRHASPPPKPATGDKTAKEPTSNPAEAPPKNEPIPIDMLIGAHAHSGLGVGA